MTGPSSARVERDLASGQFRSVMTAADRFLTFVEKSDGCWSWTGRADRHGYGRFRVDGGDPAAHKWAYEHFVGPIPDGLQIDHTCHTKDHACPGGTTCAHRRCVNPAHLEAVTGAENTRRGRSANGEKTHCANGHEYSPTNTYTNQRTNQRYCRICKRAGKRRARASGRKT